MTNSANGMTDKMLERQKAVFEAGAAAKTPTPVFGGYPLGSMDSCTFYDGYASTHPEFKNPYRSYYGR